MLRLFYICYFLVSGVSIPFFPAYLRNLGFGGKAVSSILVMAPLMQLGVPLVWGWLADRTRRPDKVLRLLCFGAFLAGVPLVFARTWPVIASLYVLQQVFAGSIMALADSVAVARHREGKTRYTHVRLWGSLSFVAVCVLVGKLLDIRAVPGGDAIIPLAMCCGYALAFLTTLTLKSHDRFEPPHRRDVQILLRDHRFRFLLAVAGTHWLCLTPYHDYFGILLQDRGFPKATTSHAFFVGVCAEIAVFLAFARLRSRVALLPMFILAFAATVLRWLLFAHTRSADLVIATQLLHGLTFGVFWAASMAWIGECVAKNLRATGQVLFSTTMAVGKMIGVLGSGALYDALGGAGPAFTAAGVAEGIPLALAIAYWAKRRPARIAAAG